MTMIVRKAAGKVWSPVMGAEVQFAPIDRAMLLRARRVARDVSVQADDETDTISSIDLIEEMGDAMSRALILEGAKDWRGVCLMADDDDQGAGEPLAFSRENLELALLDPVTFEAFDAAYVMPFIVRERKRSEPGNVFAASPSGTGEAATPDSDIASSRAQRRAGGAAKRARTSQTSRKRKPKSESGTS